ncbi:hypothetical protein AgCh_010455 [Apium graveolens]
MGCFKDLRVDGVSDCDLVGGVDIENEGGVVVNEGNDDRGRKWGVIVEVVGNDCEVKIEDHGKNNESGARVENGEVVFRIRGNDCEVKVEDHFGLKDESGVGVDNGEVDVRDVGTEHDYMVEEDDCGLLVMKESDIALHGELLVESESIDMGLVAGIGADEAEFGESKETGIKSEETLKKELADFKIKLSSLVVAEPKKNMLQEKISFKSIFEFGSVSHIVSGRLESFETLEKKKEKTEEELELKRKSEMLRQEGAAKLKEKLKRKERAKTREALKSTRQNAEKAQMRAMLRTQREAEPMENESIFSLHDQLGKITKDTHPISEYLGDIKGPTPNRVNANDAINKDTLLENVARDHTITWKQMEIPQTVARLETIGIFLANAAHINFKVFQLDVQSAFLNGELDEEVYVKHPLGFIDPKHPNNVYKLDKTLYGLK